MGIWIVVVVLDLLGIAWLQIFNAGRLHLYQTAAVCRNIDWVLRRFAVADAVGWSAGEGCRHCECVYLTVSLS